MRRGNTWGHHVVTCKEERDSCVSDKRVRVCVYVHVCTHASGGTPKQYVHVM